MALYDYRCKKCGETFEVRQKFSEEPLTVHEGCGGPVQRLISAPALQFKGTGWYVTDYGRGGKSPSTEGAKSDSKSESKSDSKSDSSKSDSSKTESKSETKSESKSEPAKSSPEKK
jgi:putative FmdB family regulatory protein